MAYAFGDSFDLYAALADVGAGYWDSFYTGTTSVVLSAGRFAGSQAIGSATATLAYGYKNSPSNDAVHHVTVAWYMGVAFTGTALGHYIQIGDGATGQCCVVVRGDGAILLTSGTPGGTVLATWTGGVPSTGVWHAYEFEIIINNVTGGMRARRNGSSSNDYDSYTAVGNLNTRGGTANNYGNRLTIGMNANVAPFNTTGAVRFDDVIWRSDASSVPWIGDVRIIARPPASDAAVQFSRSASSVTQQGPNNGATTLNMSNTSAKYSTITPTITGAVPTVSVTITTGNAGNLKCAIFADNGANFPGALLGTATTPLAATAGQLNFTFSPAVSVVGGTKYWVGLMPDTSSGSFTAGVSSTLGAQAVTTYAAFPTSNPTGTTGQSPNISLSYTLNANYPLVAEPQQDAATSYVYDSTPGHADFYGLAALSFTPQAVYGVVTRGFVQKSDAGARSGAVQLKSGATTVASASTALSSSWQWLWRTDLTDPATGSAWTVAGANNAQPGPVVTA
jgi:hypothetical protein